MSEESQAVEKEESFDEIFSSELDGDAPATDKKEPEPEPKAKAEETPEPDAESKPDEGEDKGEDTDDEDAIEKMAEEFAAKEDAPPASEEKSIIPVAALMDERDRRQAAEARVKELEAQAKGAEPRPDLLENPEAFAKHIEDEVNQGVLNRHFESSEYRARKEHGEEAVDDAMGVFEEMAKADPLLAQKALAHPEPFDFVIETVTAHKQIEEAGGLQEWKDTQLQKMRVELTAEIEAKLSGKAKAKDETRSSLPETLAGEANKGERTSPEWSEPDLDDMVTNIEDR